MPEDWLSESLRHADRQLAREEAPVDPQHIRTRVTRRRRRRRAAQAGMLVLLAAAGIIALLAGQPPKQNAIPRALSDRSNAPKLPVLPDDELSVAQRIALEAQIRLDHRLLTARARSIDGIDLAEQRDEAARTMVQVAQRRQEIAGQQEAAELYQRTIALFPETTSASTARVALAQMKQNN